MSDSKSTSAPKAPAESLFIVVNGADDRDAGIYSDNFYSRRMTKLRSSIRRRMLPWVRSETKDLAELQVGEYHIYLCKSEQEPWPSLDPYIQLGGLVGSIGFSSNWRLKNSHEPYHPTLLASMEDAILG
jgi:hypothetical protein